MKQNEVEKSEVGKIATPQDWNREFQAFYSDLVSAVEIEERQLRRWLSRSDARTVQAAIEVGLLSSEPPSQWETGSYTDMAEGLKKMPAAAVARAMIDAPALSGFLMAHLKLARHAQTLAEWQDWDWSAMGADDAIDWSSHAARREYMSRFARWVAGDALRLMRWQASGLTFDDLLE